MELDSRQTIIIAILVLFLGKALNRKIGFLRQFNIPAPVTGGVLAAVFFGFLHLRFHLDIDFTDTYRDILLVVFFTAIGLKTDLQSIVKGGRVLLLFSVLAVVFLFVQNLAGVGVAMVFGANPNVGVLAGSTALQGGHGNVVAWVPILARDYGVTSGMEIGMATATFGLILGGLLGGPVSKFLIQRNDLKTSDDPDLTVGKKDGASLTIDYDSALKVILMVFLAIGLGIHLNKLAASLGFALPLFVPCLIVGILIANTQPRVFPSVPIVTGTPVLALISEFSLSVFLSMSLMSMKLWTLLGLAGPLFGILGMQAVITIAFSIFVLFPLMGGTYRAAVLGAGFGGFALGATPTAIANMTAVTKRYGPAPMAFIILPLVSAFFVDIANAFIIKFFVSL